MKDYIKRMDELSKMKGKLNIYNCKYCGNTIITVDKDKCVTPAMISCNEYNGCDQMMMSMMYNVPPILAPSHEWYVPIDLTKIDKHLHQHIKDGGGILRKIKI